MALARSRRDSGMNYWPGFVDALSTLILSIIFLLTVFMVAQFFLSQEVSGKDTALARLNAQIARLTDLLSLERAGKTSLEDEIARLRASLSAVEGERDRLRGLAAASQAAANDKAEVGKLNSQIDLEKAATARARRADRDPQSADHRAPPPDRRARGSARTLREEGKRIAAAHHRSRPTPERGAGAAGAGIVALPLGFLRQAARNSRQPPRHPHRRRPLCVPIGGILRQRRRRAAARGPRRARPIGDSTA